MRQPDRALVAALEPFMNENGFHFVRSREAFLRQRPYGFDDFSWATYPLKTGPKWSAGYYEGYHGLGMRHDSIESIYQALNLTHGEENRRYHLTAYRAVCAEFFPFDPSRDQELCLRFDGLEADVTEAAQRIEIMLETDGFDWYRRYADPVTLSRDLNNPIETWNKHPLMNNGEFRPLVGVAAACVAEPARVGSLVNAYLEYTKSEDERLAGKRAPQAPILAKRLASLRDKARELGCAV